MSLCIYKLQLLFHKATMKLFRGHHHVSVRGAQPTRHDPGIIRTNTTTTPVLLSLAEYSEK